MYSNHPYESYIPIGATKLIIGSITPYRFCINHGELDNDDVRFYYGSSKNHFWKIVGEVTKTNFSFCNTEEAVNQRKKWLDDYNIGITDVVSRCIHDGGRSDDGSLLEIEYRDINKLLVDNLSLKTLICTSDFVRRHLKKIIKGKWVRVDSRVWSVDINDRIYKVIVLYSPSPSALRGMGKDGNQKRRNQYEDVFKNVLKSN